jgi:hypothetical protein
MYTYKDRKLTKEQVDKLAAEKGVEVDVFLTNNPDIQIQEAVVETTEPEGKTLTTEMDTTVDVTEVSKSTESPLEPGSSGFTEEGEIILSGEEVEEGVVALEPVGLEEVVVTAEEYKQREKDLQAVAVKEMFEKAGLEAPSIMEEKNEGDLSPITEFEETQRISADDKKQRDLREKERQYYADNPDKLSAKQSIFNSITNGLGQLSTIDDRAKWLGSYISSDIDLVRNLFPKETADKILKSASKNLGEATADIDKVSSYGGKTIGFTELKDRDGLGSKAAGGLAAAFNALSAFGTSAATNYLTFGVGLATDMIGGSVKSYNEKKAADLGITVDQLIASGNAETLVPASLGVLGYSLERYGIKGVNKYINSLSNKGAKTVFSLLNVGQKEGITEWTQSGIEKLNENLAKDMSPDEAGLSAIDYMFSLEGLENYFQGFVGGSGVGASGLALSSIRSKPNKERISKLINDLNILEDQKFAKNLTEKEISLINTSQDAIRLELKSTVNEANELLAVLPSESIESINENADLLTSYNSQIQEINKDPKYTQEVKDLMISELVKKRDVASQNISDVRNEAERLVSNIERAKEASKDIEGLDFKDFANAEEIKEFLKTQDKDIDSKASGQQGFIIQDKDTGKQTIVINREIAAKEKAMNIAGHELGHAITYNTIKNSPETAVNLGEALLTELNKIDSNAIKDSNFKKRMELYANESKEVQMEEALTLFSDALATGDVQFKENIFTKIGDQIRRVIQSFGVKTKFNTGRDVYNFIKDYNKSLEKGKLSKSQLSLAQEGAEGELVKPKTQTDEQIIKDSRSEEASTRVQELYDAQGEAAAFDIIEQFKPITSKIVEKRSQAPGFDRQLLTDEIETGKRGILDLVREYDAESGVPLAAYINKFLPARAIEASKRILGEEFTDDVTEAKGVAAEEVSVDVTPTDKSTTSKLRRVLGIKQDDAIYDLAKEVSGEILSGDLPGKKVKTAINKEARKSKLRKAVSDLMGTEKAIDEQFLNKNILEILKALPASDLVKLEREAKVKVLAEQGPRLNVKDAREAVNKGLLPKDTNLQSGPKVSSKLPTTLEQAKEFFTQKRKAGLVNVVTEMLVKDAAPEVTKDKMEPAKRAKVLADIDRAPTLKFSKINEFIDSQDFIKTELELAAENKVWKYIAKELGVDVLSSKNPEDVIKYRNWVKANASKFPKSFFTTGTFANAGASAAKRNFYFTSAEDLNAFLEGVEFAKEDADIAEAVNRQTYVTGGADGKISDKFKKAFNTKDFKDKQASKLRGLKKIYKIFETIIDENSSDASFVIAMLSSTSQGMGHFVRTSAPIKFYSKYLEGGIVEEHTMPASLVAKYLFTSAINKTIDKDFKDIERNYFQGALGKFDDKKLKGKKPNGKPYNYTSMTPEGWKITDNIWARYFNINVAGNNFGIDPNNIVLADGKTVFETYGVSNTGALVSDQFNSDQQKASVGNNKNLPADLRVEDSKSMPSVLSETKVVDENNVKEEIKFSKALNLDKDFNDIIENKTGIASDKTYARVKAEVAGANKGKFNFFIPPSAEDFVGLLYSTLGKGSTGDAQMAWYKAHLLNPFARAMENLANDRANMMQDFRGLKKALKIVPKNLRKKIKDSNFTKEQAVRAYIWDKQGMEIPGLSQKDQQALVEFIETDENLKSFAGELIAINKGDAYAAPDAGWVAGTIDTDFIKALNTTKRSKYLEVWQQNVDQIFSEANLNKLEAAYGANYREAMVDMLKRMETGRNTSSGSDRLAARFTDWLTNSVGAIMFFNTRSAVLQTISAVNFINFSDNNVLKAGQAFANQPQYWSDFKKLFNSPFLLDRRSGLKLNVNEADIAAMAKGPGNSARNVIAGILKAGFLPTQLADSFAIASGGASFYRNRIKALQKEGLTEAEAEEQAFRDFREIAEESQQSSRPDKISQQQAGPLGRVILAFANTPAQYARLIKKAASDLKNGRGDAKTNISKIIYYGVAQNLLFSALQQALFAIAFDDEEEEEKKNEKYFNIVNGMSDSVLRGIGIGGAIVSTVKNTALRLAKEADKKSPKYQDAVVKGVLQISPPVSSKVGKLQSAGRSFSWNQEEMRTRGWSIDNPAYLASANVISAATNIPLDRAVKKVTNIVDAGNEDIEYYKRVALALGWSAWELGIDKKGGKVTPPKTDMDKLYDLNKKQQIDSLASLGISKKQIKLLKLEEDRVNAILNPKSIKKIKVSKKDSLFGLNKKDQVKALEKLGLTKKEIRALRLESDRVEAIINKQKQEN